MSSLLGPDGAPLNPAAYFQLVPDETIDMIYDAFDSEAPFHYQIEWDGMKHELTVFGWTPTQTVEGWYYYEFGKVTVPIDIPEGYFHVDDVSPERTIQ